MSKQQQYELLALAFSYPQEELISAIRTGVYDKLLASSAPIPIRLEDLEVEYCRLFVGPGHVEVPPYESVYRQHDINMQAGLVMGESALEVKAKYQQAGLQITDDFHDMPDHIAVEILFLAYLEAMAGMYPEAGYQEDKQRFIHEHLGRWVEPFAREVMEHSRHPWYTFASYLLIDIIQSEAAEITM